MVMFELVVTGVEAVDAATDSGGRSTFDVGVEKGVSVVTAVVSTGVIVT